jgi:maltose O-acetyltransferase
VNIETGASFGPGNSVFLGDRSELGINCELYGEVHIGNCVMMGPQVVVWTTNHRFDRVDIPMVDQGNGQMRPVVIGDDVWIGTRAIILPGVRIGQGAVVGAGAVVSKDVPSWAVVVGNPAKVVRLRKQISADDTRMAPSDAKEGVE